MLNSHVALLRQEFSMEQAFNHVVEISQHHRIQASPGHRAAAKYCAAVFEQAGLETKILSYPGDGKKRYWEYLMPEEWVATKGVLEMVAPEHEVLANFNNIPISLIQRSAATPAKGVEAELIILDKGDEEEAYGDIDLQNKLVMTSGDYDYVREWAVEKRGALGIITDRMAEFPPVRHRYDIGDALTYTSFWWSGTEKRCFGFVLSPKAGDKLRKQAAQGLSIRLKATVDAKFYPGEIEVVSALIKGKSHQEVVVIAHLCHPQPSANDNASGCGVALETARALQELIKQHKLTKPERSIRFLLLPEMTGSYAFLANNENLIPNMVAALNLDMVGENQCLCHGPLIAERPPHTCGHYAGDLIETALAAVAAEVPNLAGTASYALFKHTVTPFSGGSDHYIFSDPTVGVGSPMLIQWPDKFYHTSMDTIDKVDPEMLKRVGLLTGSYAWFNATARESEAIWLANRMLTMFKHNSGIFINEQLAKAVKLINTQSFQEAMAIRDSVSKHLRYLLDVKAAELKSLLKLTEADTFSNWIDQAIQNLEEYVICQVDEWLSTFNQLALTADVDFTRVKATSNVNTDEWLRQARNILPKRLSKGPISLRGRISSLPDEMQQEYRRIQKQRGSELRKMTYLLYWMDGKRDLAAIIDLVEHEIGSINHQVAVFLINMLAEMGLIAVSNF